MDGRLSGGGDLRRGLIGGRPSGGGDLRRGLIDGSPSGGSSGGGGDSPTPLLSKKAHLLPRSLSYHHHHQYRPAAKPPLHPNHRPATADDAAPASKRSAVLYTTSLRSIRRTHEDCSTLRNILRGLRVAFDERDVSMDSSFRRELHSLLGTKSGPLPLPQLFLGPRCLGGADHVRQLHEAGDLRRLLDGLPVQDPAFVCAGCGGARFIPCPNCSGSRKVFAEDEGRMRRCDKCNENGLVRCPNCCFC